MREIKFRAWHFGQNRMFSAEEMTKDQMALLPDGHFANIHGADTARSTIFSHDKMLPLQFTGLRDASGKEIYEGDIVVQDGYKWFDNGAPNYRGTVEWIYSQWQVVAHCVNPNKAGISDGINEGLNDEGLDEWGCANWTVIGNIYENGSLLNGE